MSVLGLPLSEALAILNSVVRVVETKPPFEPRHYTPIWGQPRVVRERKLEDGTPELTVARELLREERNERQ